jgi:hypothetical protein
VAKERSSLSYMKNPRKLIGDLSNETGQKAQLLLLSLNINWFFCPFNFSVQLLLSSDLVVSALKLKTISTLQHSHHIPRKSTIYISECGRYHIPSYGGALWMLFHLLFALSFCHECENIKV